MYTLVPLWLNWLFLFSAVLTIFLFYFLHGRPNKLIAVILVYAIVQSILAGTGVYNKPEALPPPPLFIMLPMVLFIIYGLLPKQRNWILENREHQWSPLIHIVRIPVEITLFYLFAYHTIPELMTFEGRNYDILAGLSSPLILFLMHKGIVKRKGLLAWNIICLGLVLFIVVNAVLSLETPIQTFGFEQPNVAVLHFPYVLLPAIIVPLVIYVHLTDIIYLLHAKRR